MNAITPRENLLHLLRGDTPQWMPCSINVWQWFEHHRKFATLPPELAHATNRLDVMRHLGCDLFVRTACGVHAHHEGEPPQVTQEPGAMGPRHVTTIATPHGTLRSISEEQTQYTSNYQVEDLIKDWDTDRRALLWHEDRTRFGFDPTGFVKADGDVGDDGVVLCSLPATPLKHLHHVFGLDGACLFVLDHPDDAKALCDLYWSRLRPALSQLAEQPGVAAVCFEDNVDTPFYPPGIIDRYWVPYVREAADLFGERGVAVFVHACGKLHDLLPAFRDAGVSGLDGMPHPPLGDFTVEDAAALGDRFIYDGGFSAHEQVTMNDDAFDRHYERFFAELDGRRGFIFAAACQTAITTPWTRIQKAVATARAYGGAPVRPAAA